MTAPSSDALEILVIATRFPLASETFVEQQCADLVRLGHRVEILTLQEGDGSWTAARPADRLPERTRCAHLGAPLATRLMRAPARAARLAARSPASLLRAATPIGGRRAINGQFLAIADTIAAPRRFDLIHCHFGPAGVVAAELLRAGLLSGPLSVGFYGYDLTREPLRRGRDLYRGLFARASLLLPHSRYLADRLIALGAPADRIHLHRLGIDLSRFPATDRSARTGPATALAVGRFVEKKGFEYLLRAFARAATDMRLRIVGDGPLRPALEQLAHELGIAPRVTFTGWLPPAGVAREMHEADLLVTPSVTAADGDMEGLPLVVIEAMATGLPVIGTAHSGIPEIVVDGETGAVVPERDIEALAAALGRLDDRATRAGLAQASRGRVERAFDGTSLAEQLCDLARALRGPRDDGSAGGVRFRID
ncbi:MAG: hypothetical protein RL136_956 [Planctomycetota bacterium]|jgi:colanic acid/amylovoran biosynthesis glycosyltransferase